MSLAGRTGNFDKSLKVHMYMPMKKSVYSLALVLIVGAWNANAGHGPIDSKAGSKGLPPDLAKYDANGDGVLSAEEKAALKAALDAKRQAFLDKYDTNKDGVLDATERAAAEADRAAAIKAERTADFATLDADGNGKVTLAEFKAANPKAPAARAEALFKRLDADSDGNITLEEYLATPTGKPPGHR